MLGAKQAAFTRPDDGFAAAVYRQFRIDRGYVIADGIGRQPQARGDFLVGQALAAGTLQHVGAPRLGVDSVDLRLYGPGAHWPQVEPTWPIVNSSTHASNERRGALSARPTQAFRARHWFGVFTWREYRLVEWG